MKRFTIRQWILFALVVLSVTIAVADPNDVSPAQVVQDFPIILAIPFILGKIAHWYKKWQFEKIQVNFLQWWFSDAVSSVITILVSLSVFMGQYALNPSLYAMSSFSQAISVWITVFLSAVAVDTLNNAKGVPPNTRQAGVEPPAELKC